MKVYLTILFVVLVLSLAGCSSPEQKQVSSNNIQNQENPLDIITTTTSLKQDLDSIEKDGNKISINYVRYVFQAPNPLRIEEVDETLLTNVTAQEKAEILEMFKNSVRAFTQSSTYTEGEKKQREVLTQIKAKYGDVLKKAVSVSVNVKTDEEISPVTYGLDLYFPNNNKFASQINGAGEIDLTKNFNLYSSFKDYPEENVFYVVIMIENKYISTLESCNKISDIGYSCDMDKLSKEDNVFVLKVDRNQIKDYTSIES